MSFHIVRIQDNQLVGTLSPVDDPERFEWDEGETIEIFADHQDFERRLESFKPPVRPIPDWAQFQSTMLMNGSYMRIVGTNAMTLTLNSALVWMLGEVGQHSDRLGDVINTWNAIAYIAQVTPAETENLRRICVDCKMPFDLVDGGFMVAV